MVANLFASEYLYLFKISLGITLPIFPMTDDILKTIVVTEVSDMSFQEYFVKNRCEPRVISLKFDSPSECSPSPGFVTALDESDLLVFCPTNPFSPLPAWALPAHDERTPD